MGMGLVNRVLDMVVPPASLVMLACAWPALCFISTCEWIYSAVFSEDMEDKVVLITGASSSVGEQIAYEYAKRRTNLVLVARRENRLRGISENALELGAKHVMIIAADVVKEDDCRRFVNETINFYGRVDHLVNTAILGHAFYFEEAADTSFFSPFVGHKFLGKCLSNLCSSALPAPKQWPDSRKCINRELVTCTNNEPLRCCKSCPSQLL